MFYTPWIVWYVVNRIYTSVPSIQTPEIMAGLNLFQTLSFLIGYLNNGSSFVLNLVFNSIFQQEVYLVLGIKSNLNNEQLGGSSKESNRLSKQGILSTKASK